MNLADLRTRTARPAGATRRRTMAAGLAAATVGALGVSASVAGAVVAPGTPGKDVTIGLDNDNADNAFIQPPGVAAKQHMDNTDVLFGRGNADLLIGRLGDDTLLAGPGPDILIGGPEAFVAPNSDVLVGERGNDINVWAPGDGSDAFVGGPGYDTMVFGPLRLKPNGDPKLVWRHGRRVPRVTLEELPQFSCEIVPVPEAEKLGAQFLVRFAVNGTTAVTVRQKDVERVLCPSPNAGKASVARLTDQHPRFREVSLSHIGGILGKIVAP